MHIFFLISQHNLTFLCEIFDGSVVVQAAVDDVGGRYFLKKKKQKYTSRLHVRESLTKFDHTSEQLGISRELM